MAKELIPPDDRYGVLLPCTPETFADFVSGLLGTPQTIEQKLLNSFELNLRDIENLHHLLDQRVRQQNDASLLQFSAKIFFNDNSSVLLASLSDLLHYNEVRPVVSDGVHLVWTYLIKFPDKPVPEKQQVEITFRSLLEEMAIEEAGFMSRPRVVIREPRITVRIAHTARSWGVDIQSLLTNHLQSLLVEEPPLRRLAAKHSGKVAFTAFLVAFGAIAGAMLITRKALDDERARQASEVLGSGLNPQLEYIIRLLSAGETVQASAAGFLTIGAFVLALSIAVVTSAVCESLPPSFVLLTSLSEVRRRKLLAKRRRNWFVFIGTLIAAIATGVVGNWVYAWIAGA